MKPTDVHRIRGGDLTPRIARLAAVLAVAVAVFAPARASADTWAPVESSDPIIAHADYAWPWSITNWSISGNCAGVNYCDFSVWRYDGGPAAGYVEYYDSSGVHEISIDDVEFVGGVTPYSFATWDLEMTGTDVNDPGTDTDNRPVGIELHAVTENQIYGSMTIHSGLNHYCPDHYDDCVT